MKRILSLLLTLTLVVTFFALGQTEVEAAPVSTCTTNRTVFVHYHRWDGMYTDTTIHTWNNGTNGSGADSTIIEEDGFGGIYQICVDDDAAEWDDNLGDNQTVTVRLGLIMKYSAAWTDGWNDRDAVDTDMNGSKDGNHKLISIRENDEWVGFDTNGEKHVYVFEGSNQVIYEDDANSLPYSEDVATIAVIYYDPAEDYDNWNVWAWGAGTLGTKADPIPDSDTGLLWSSQLGVDGGTVENFRVVFLQVDPADMGENVGIIVRTNSWEKKFDGDVNISTDGLVAGDFKTVFYIAGEGFVRDTFEDFEATVNFFEIEAVTALDPNSIEVLFNKDVVTMEDDEATLSVDNFMVKDKSGQTVELTQLSFNSTTEVNDTFTLITETALSGDNSPYKVYYMPGGFEVYSKNFDVDSVAPVITILGPTATTLELGDSYSLPNYFATDEVDGGTVDIYNVRVKDGMGTVDTRNAGIYEVVIEASDKFGNVAEATITVTVTDPCDATAHLNANNNNVGLISLLVGLPLAFGAFITLRKNY